MPRFINRFVLAGLGMAATSGLVSADCCLEGCPAESGPAPGTHPWSLQVDASETGFDFSPTLSGNYTRVTVRTQYQARDRWTFGLGLPVVFLAMDDGSRDTGLGNLSGLVDYRVWSNRSTSVQAGVQLDSPTGDAGAGIAMGHWSFLPYLSAAAEVHRWRLFGSGGFREMSEDFDSPDPAGEHVHHHHMASPDDRPLVVDPHAKSEIPFRLGVAYEWSPALATTVTLDGQHVLTDSEMAEDPLHLGLALSVPLSGIELGPMVQMPLRDARRFEWRAGTTLTRRF